MSAAQNAPEGREVVMTSENWARVASALLLPRRSAQVMWMRTPSFVDYLADFLTRHEAGQHVTGEDAIISLAQTLTEPWVEGDRYVLSMSATAALFSGARTLAADVLPPVHPDDLPSPSGLVMLPKSLPGLSMRGDRVAVSAISWGPCYAAPGTPGVFLATWTHKDADDDDHLRAQRTSQGLFREKAKQTMAENRVLLQTLDNDHETPAEEKAHLRELVARRQASARSALQVASRPAPGGDYVLLDLQPVPLMTEYHGKVGNGRHAHEEATTAMDAADPDASSLVTRLPYVLWGMLAGGVMRRDPIALMPKVERKFSKRSLPYSVDAVSLADPAIRGNLVTVARTRVRDGESKTVRNQFQWTAEMPLTARAL